MSESATATDLASMRPWRVWLMAARPRTLAVSVGPIAVGTAVAAAEGAANLSAALAALLGALLIQIGSNFANDLFDFEKGADTDARVGPPRATQLGLLSASQMRRGIAGVFVAALLVGLYLVWVAGWGVFFVGIVCIVAAITYTGGPWPYGYHGLGDPMVFLFFGVVAVVGTSYVETLALSTQALVASVPVGLLATAILVVNNLRDIDTDRVAGKRTLAVRLGPGGARAEYIALLAVAYGMLPGYWLIAGRSAWVLLPLLTLPIAWKRAQTVLTSSQAEELTGALAGTAQLGLVFSVLLALGWVL